ncbi:MAG: hypothetical protein AAGB34_11620, partial [Planctomycetota bacterium]
MNHALALASFFIAPVSLGGYFHNDADFAVSVVAYHAGTSVGVDFISREPYSNPASALGRPTIDTTGDGFAGPPSAAIPVVPPYAAFRAHELVTIGGGGHLILELGTPATNDPDNPHGIDLIVFGNAFST